MCAALPSGSSTTSPLRLEGLSARSADRVPSAERGLAVLGGRVGSARCSRALQRVRWSALARWKGCAAYAGLVRAQELKETEQGPEKKRIREKTRDLARAVQGLGVGSEGTVAVSRVAVHCRPVCLGLLELVQNPFCPSADCSHRLGHDPPRGRLTCIQGGTTVEALDLRAGNRIRRSRNNRPSAMAWFGCECNAEHRVWLNRPGNAGGSLV